tara:strand:- start:109 stop:354 length:246 start_codon:yes stop_codon:yes gene_type:complete
MILPVLPMVGAHQIRPQRLQIVLQDDHGCQQILVSNPVRIAALHRANAGMGAQVICSYPSSSTKAGMFQVEPPAGDMRESW